MWVAVLIGFLAAPLAPLFYQILRDYLGWVVTLVPLGLFIFFGMTYLEPITAGKVLVANYEWIPSLGINLAFRMDGLSLLFALVISGIGTLVFFYAGGYLHGDPNLGKFYAYLLIFMASMLGVVLSNNIILIFIFWELTSISSYLLIGYYGDREISREAAKMAFIVTGSAGLALLAGMILLSLVTNTMLVSEMFSQHEHVVEHHLYLPILLLVGVGAFAKSAQFPFHFWLPGAMEAPAPVSAYLHSATMVKAGIYLLARLHPILGETDEWRLIVTLVGGITMLVGGYLAWQQVDVKRILAYTTISALGILVFSLGIGTKESIKAALLFLVVHSLYKGALFMVGGIIDHETGTRNILELGGLRPHLPITWIGAILAALSMSGIPITLGFFGKEVIYEATQHAEHLPVALLTIAAIIGNMFNVTAAGMVAIRPFFGEEHHTPKHPHEAPLTMWAGPIILGIVGVILGGSVIWLHELFMPLLTEATAAVYGHEIEELELHLALNFTVLLSVITIALGIGLYFLVDQLRTSAQSYDLGEAIGPKRIYQALIDGTLEIAHQQQVLLKAPMRYYLYTILGVFLTFMIFTLATEAEFKNLINLEGVRVYEAALAAVIIMATFMVVMVKSRLAAIAALGVVGFGVAMMFILFSAPDLAMTQFAIETLSVILFVLVVYKLPTFLAFQGKVKENDLRDMIFAGITGLTMTIIVLLVNSEPLISRLTPFFAQNSYTEAQGHNVVNVILVDFRGFDTMGEITVLSIAAIGIFALLKLNLHKPDKE